MLFLESCVGRFGKFCVGFYMYAARGSKNVRFCINNTITGRFCFDQTIPINSDNLRI